MTNTQVDLMTTLEYYTDGVVPRTIGAKIADFDDLLALGYVRFFKKQTPLSNTIDFIMGRTQKRTYVTLTEKGQKDLNAFILGPTLTKEAVEVEEVKTQKIYFMNEGEDLQDVFDRMTQDVLTEAIDSSKQTNQAVSVTIQRPKCIHTFFPDTRNTHIDKDGSHGWEVCGWDGDDVSWRLNISTMTQGQ